jgi:type VI secretion system secreted protein VgrG
MDLMLWSFIVSLSQDRRVGHLVTPLGKDILCLFDLVASEGMSELFSFNILAVSLDNNIDLDTLLGQSCHVVADEGTLGRRFYHGIVTEAMWERTEGDLNYYRLLLRPWIWLLGKTSDCRIFHDKTVLEIVSETFQRHGFRDFRLATTHSYPTLHYTVQYRETDLNFVERLLEQHGISWFFEHSENNHTLVLADGRSSHTPAPDLAQVKFNAGTREHKQAREPVLDHWSLSRRLRSGKVALTDYNHLTPNAQMRADHVGSESYEYNALELFDFPGIYAKQDDGSLYARVRLEAEQCVDKRRQGRGNALALVPGVTTTLVQHPRAPENTDYLVVRVNSRVGPQFYRNESDSGADQGYSASYECQGLDVPYRSPFNAIKPFISSLQTATVVGEEGEEIDCDNHGRILVHFHWDRHNDRSCRLRVSQVWGGQGWGSQVIPRIGMEVMVAYLEGDPDRPIVVGCVPNPQTKGVPYELPANKTRMVWRSATHKGSGFNEMSFEDKTGGENLFVNASKDKTTRVRNTHTERIDKHQVSSIGANRALEVGGNQKTEIKKSFNLTVGGAGAGALALMAPLAGLAPITSGLLKQAGDIAGGGGAAIGGMAASLAGSALGFLGGGGLGAREGVVAGSEPREDAGTALANSGNALGKAAKGLFGLPGVMNTVVGSFKSDSTGIASIEQVGVAKVTNVGASFLENVGKFKKIAVGEEFVIEVGDSKFIMKKDGTVLILGKKFNFIATDHFQMRGKPIDLN